METDTKNYTANYLISVSPGHDTSFVFFSPATLHEKHWAAVKAIY